MNTLSITELTEKLENLKKNDTWEFYGIIKEINSQDGSFEDFTLFQFEDLENFMSADEIVRAFVYGDGVHAYNSEYLKFDAYGNLYATDIDDITSDITPEEVADAILEIGVDMFSINIDSL